MSDDDRPGAWDKSQVTTAVASPSGCSLTANSSGPAQPSADGSSVYYDPHEARYADGPSPYAQRLSLEEAKTRLVNSETKYLAWETADHDPNGRNVVWVMYELDASKDNEQLTNDETHSFQLLSRDFQDLVTWQSNKWKVARDRRVMFTNQSGYLTIRPPRLTND